MSIKKQKLELTWIGKDERPRLEPRILIEDSEKSYHAHHRITENDIFDNKLIFGDNLLALKALEQEYAGKVKCVYIDPPYNIDAATTFYEDGLRHSEWLSLIRDRLELIFSLLTEDGVLFVQIDDEEMAYLTVLLDEIFGRTNRVNIIAVKMSESTGVKMAHAKKRFPKLKEFILVYKKNLIPAIKPIRLPLSKWNEEYKEIVLNISEQDLDLIKDYMDGEAYEDNAIQEVNKLLSEAKVISLSKYFRDNKIGDDQQEDFKWQNSWRIVQAVGAGSLKDRALKIRLDSQDICAVLSAQKKLYLFKSSFDESSKDPRIKIIFADKYLQYNPGDFWTDIKTSGGVGQEGGILFPKGKKPEALIQRILDTVTKSGDIVLDSFAGSGTTGAVAHKMGRRWIMIELGEHCDTHIIPRMKKVIDGDDKGGVTEAAGWRGGGGFRYYRLAPSLITHDQYGQPIISKEYNAAMLSEAVCKLMGFTYAPSEEHYWRHGHSSEQDFIYVTTQSLTHDQLRAISDDIGENRSLLICCKAFRLSNPDAFPNLTINKIPQAVLKKCEWGKDDYGLNIQSLPMAESELVAEPKRGKAKNTALPLFGDDANE